MHKLVEYFIKAQKNKKTNCLGLEVEHFILHKETKQPMKYSQIARLMDFLSKFYPKKYYEDTRLIALESNNVLITLEPGCQLEVSLAYLDDLEMIRSIYLSAMQPINDYLEALDYQIVYSGGLPTIDANKVERIDKKRYEYMEEYFKKTGTRGHEMMKASAAVHVSIDYEDELDFVKKYRMANILHPILAFLCSNTKYFAGHHNEDLLLRDTIWANTDPSRCGVIPTLFDKDFGYALYAEWLENIELILMADHGNFIPTKNKTIKEVAEVYGFNDEAISHYLSMSFLDIRLKRFIEIRSADSMPIEYTIAYLALIKGLFYHGDNLEKYSSMINSIESIQLMKDHLRKEDWNALIKDKDCQSFCIELIEDAKKGLSAQEQKLLIPLNDLIDKRTHIFKEVYYEL